MAFWNRKKNWEDEYDELYAQDRGVKEPGRKGYSGFRFVPHALFLVIVGCVFLGAVAAVSGPTMVEKMLTDLAMPVGLVWLILMVMVYFCMLNRQTWPALVGMICWLILTVAGNKFCASWLISNLEQPYQQINVFELEPLDTIVVLGGGTSSRLNGQSQFGSSGDRVGTAARMYHAGQVENLICTGGRSFRASKQDLNPREEAANLLISLGVPAERVVQMEGKNTYQEMQQLKKWQEANPEHGRLGLVTSAWHLPRVMRLAKSIELELIPIPCDFQTSGPGPSPNLIVPSSVYLETTRHAMKEYLAAWVGR